MFQQIRLVESNSGFGVMSGSLMSAGPCGFP
jgi:hypothetical protein